jgi:hypothetical protein
MLANLRALFGVVVDIVLLRRGPEHLPVSQPLLVVVVALNCVASLIMGAVNGLAWHQALIQSLVGVAVMLSWYHLALSLANKRERFLQTMTGLFAVNVLFMPLIIPLLNEVMPYLQKPDPAVPPPMGAALLSFLIGVWVLVVEVRIVRAAFECPWLGAVLLVIGELFAAGLVGMMLFGQPPKPV